MQLYFGREDWIQQAVFALRRSVFVDEQGIAPELEFDQKDQFCHYFLLAEGQVPLPLFAINRWIRKRSSPIAFAWLKTIESKDRTAVVSGL